MLDIQRHPVFTDYGIDREGRVYSFKADRVRELKPQKNGTGYVVYYLMLDGKRHTKTAHSLVLETYAEPRKGREVCHSDGNKANNKLSNLRWCSHSENELDKSRHTRPSAKINQALTLRSIGLTYREIGTRLGVTGETISNWLRGKTRDVS